MGNSLAGRWSFHAWLQWSHDSRSSLINMLSRFLLSQEPTPCCGFTTCFHHQEPLTLLTAWCHSPKDVDCLLVSGMPPSQVSQNKPWLNGLQRNEKERKHKNPFMADIEPARSSLKINKTMRHLGGSVS